MLKDCLEIFSEKVRQYGERVVLDSYIPPNGMYLLVLFSDNGTVRVEASEVQYNKKSDSLEWDADEQQKNAVKFYDYYSTLVDMNKPMDSKKIIQSNNYLAFFIKQESLSNGKLTRKGIQSYYETMRHPEEKYTGASGKALYEEVATQYGAPQQDRISTIEAWVLEHIFELDKLGVNPRGKDYLKLFFCFSSVDETKEAYMAEGRRYLIPNIYNNNDYNINMNGMTYGIPNNNLGMNAKKSFLEHKTRMVRAPYLVDRDEVMLQKLFFDFLMNHAVKRCYDIYFDLDNREILSYAEGKLPQRDIMSAVYLRLKKGKEVEIHGMDMVSGYHVRLEREFTYQNVLDIDLASSKVNLDSHPYGKRIKRLDEMQELVNSVCFSKFLINNYYTKEEDISITDTSVKRGILVSRSFLCEWFKLGKEDGVGEKFIPVIFELIRGALANDFSLRAAHLFNMYISVKEYFEGGEGSMCEAIKSSRDMVREKMNQPETIGLESDKEYYFAVGQLISYLISLSKSGKKTLSLANPYFDIKDDKVLKDKIYMLYRKYNYAIEMTDRRVKNLLAMVYGYSVKGGMDRDMMLAGFSSNNLIFEKKKEDK